MTPTRYSKSAMTLHWLIAAALAFQFGLGEAMEHAPPGPGAFDVAQFHKAIGISILLFSLARLALRFTKPRPAVMSDASWAKTLASVVHWGLYAIMILAPISGWIAASTGRFSIPIDMFGLFHWPQFPGFSAMQPDAMHDVHELSEEVHGILAKMMVLLFFLHVAGALRHQLLLGQPTLERMMPGSRILSPMSGSIHILGAAALLIGVMMWGRSGPAPQGDPEILQSIMEQRAALEKAKAQ